MDVTALKLLLGSFSPAALSWVLRARMSLEEATYLTAHPGLTDEQVDTCLKRRHGVYERRFLKRYPDLGGVVRDIDQFVTELEAMPAIVCEAFLLGRLTLLQVRYAAMRGFDQRVIVGLAIMNPPLDSIGFSPSVIDEFEPLVGEDRRAYLDRLRRSGALDESMTAAFRRDLTTIEGISAYARSISGRHRAVSAPHSTT